MKCDFHIHTFYSYDAECSPRHVVDAALEKGINCLAITDHDKLEGAFEAEKYSLGKPVLIIPGIEIKSREGDILALNVRKKIRSGLSAGETIERIKKQGGLAIIAHPFALLYGFKGNLQKFIKDIDGIEAFNASISFSENKKALDFAKKHDVAFTAGSDAHFCEFVGRTYLEFEGKDLSADEIFEKIKNKKCEIGGSEYFFFERLKDHFKRNVIKLKNYAG